MDRYLCVSINEALDPVLRIVAPLSMNCLLNCLLCVPVAALLWFLCRTLDAVFALAVLAAERCAACRHVHARACVLVAAAGRLPVS